MTHQSGLEELDSLMSYMDIDEVQTVTRQLENVSISGRKRKLDHNHDEATTKRPRVESDEYVEVSEEDDDDRYDADTEEEADEEADEGGEQEEDEPGDLNDDSVSMMSVDDDDYNNEGVFDQYQHMTGEELYDTLQTYEKTEYDSHCLNGIREALIDRGWYDQDGSETDTDATDFDPDEYYKIKDDVKEKVMNKYRFDLLNRVKMACKNALIERGWYNEDGSETDTDATDFDLDEYRYIVKKAASKATRHH